MKIESLTGYIIREQVYSLNGDSCGECSMYSFRNIDKSKVYDFPTEFEIGVDSHLLKLGIEDKIKDIEDVYVDSVHVYEVPNTFMVQIDIEYENLKIPFCKEV